MHYTKKELVMAQEEDGKQPKGIAAFPVDYLQRPINLVALCALSLN